MKYRNEHKHEISLGDMMVLRQRLSAIAKKDSHEIDGKYIIRSLYFDNAADKALLEKINGINRREKFRIRFYNYDTSFIRLEKKSKINGLCLKEHTDIDLKTVRSIIDGDYSSIIRNHSRLRKTVYRKII